MSSPAEKLRMAAVKYDVASAHDTFRRRLTKIGLAEGAALYFMYKRMSEPDKTLFMNLLEDDWKEFRKFDEEYVDAEVVEDGE